ncbi:response regulator [Candidatus Hydrogenedentota bacterium]
MPIRVLLADDHAVFRTGLRALLEKEPDFEVAGEVGTGIDAINAVEDESIDILVLDISMPGLSGPKTAEEVLKKRPDIKIVILTMHEEEHYLRELLKIGVAAYVLKKSSATELIQAIRAAAGGNGYIDSSLITNVVSPYVGIPRTEKVGRLGILTSREQEVCRLLALGHTNAEVAEQLFISSRTVETHRNKIMGKLELKNRAELVRFAIDNGLLKMS